MRPAWHERAVVLAGDRRGSRRYDGIKRRRMIEVEHVLQPIGVLIAQRQMRTFGEEALLDEGQHRGVIAHRVRDVVRLRKRRYHDERNAESELIEIRALRRVWRGFWSEKCRADGGDVALAELALRASAWQQARRRIGQVFAQARIDAVGIEGSTLRGGRRRYVIIKSTVLVVGQEDDRVLPVGSLADGPDDLRGDVFTGADVPRRVFISLEPAAHAVKNRSRRGKHLAR